MAEQMRQDERRVTGADSGSGRQIALAMAAAAPGAARPCAIA